MPDFQEIDLNIARARIVLYLIAMLSLYVDPATAGRMDSASSSSMGPRSYADVSAEASYHSMPGRCAGGDLPIIR
jgi:hypothetical protein